MKLLANYKPRRDRILEQHKLGHIDTQELQAQIKDLDKRNGENRQKLKEIQTKISQNSLSQGYEKTLELFSATYRQKLDDIFTNRQDIYNILHSLIEEIIVYSRLVKSDDIIGGKRKENQEIPYKIEIKLKLPQDILRDMAMGSFGVKSDSPPISNFPIFARPRFPPPPNFVFSLNYETPFCPLSSVEERAG